MDLLNIETPHPHSIIIQGWGTIYSVYCSHYTYCFISDYGMDLSTEHYTGKQGEKETFKYAEYDGNEDKRAWKECITT